RRGHSLSSGRQCRSGACRRSLPLPSPTAAGRGRGRRFRAPALRVGSGRPARRGGYVVIKPWHFDPERILRGRDIVCFSNDWDGDPLSKTHIMKILARDNRVLWVNSLGNRRPDLSARDLERIGKKIADIARGLREEWPNLHVLGPIALPAFGTMARTVNRIVFRQQVLMAMRKLGFRDPISWSFLPSSAPVSGALGEELLVYHCVDEFTAFSGTPEEIGEMEANLARRADVVIVSAERLKVAKEKYNSNIHVVRHGVDHAHFSKALSP